MKAITRFSGSRAVLSNFYPSPVYFDGVLYPTVEHAYQATKTMNPAERCQVRDAPTPGRAKALGRRVTLRPDWDEMKINVMRELLREKFLFNRRRGLALLSTGDAELIEGNTWGDKFWGAVWSEHHSIVAKDNLPGRWVGENHLGKLLMEIRRELVEKPA